MEDSHLLLEQPAHSAKEENLPLAHARHGIAPYASLQRLLALRALQAGQTGEDAAFRHGTRWLNTPHTPRGHYLPRQKNLFKKKKKALVQRLSTLPPAEIRAAYVPAITCGANGTLALLRRGSLERWVQESHPQHHMLQKLL